MRMMNPDTYVPVLSSVTYRPYAFRAQSPDELKRWQQAFRPFLKNMLGLETMAQRGPCDLDPRRVSTTDCGDYVREEWTIQSEPGFRLPFFLLKPKNMAAPMPVVITPHGHGRSGKDLYAGLWTTEDERQQIEEGQRDVAVQAVRQGYVAIAPDMRGIALRRSDNKGDNDCRTMQMHALLFGRTLIGERVWDVMRIIDYAMTRPDVDPSQVILTGNSAGGTVTIFAAACDERATIAIPSCAFSTYADTRGARYFCECAYIPGLLSAAELTDVAGLIAPRPLLIVNGRTDPLILAENATSAFRNLQDIYSVAGAAHACEQFIGEGGHRYYSEPVWPFVARWIEKSSKS